MQRYSIKKLADTAGITVRTLHHYDQIGLLKPSLRTEKKYRFYGVEEALRLQQILLFRELGMSLERIAAVLNDPQFDLISALENHRNLFQKKHEQMSIMLQTIDNTFSCLKTQGVPIIEELFKGLPKEGLRNWGEKIIRPVSL